MAPHSRWRTCSVPTGLESTIRTAAGDFQSKHRGETMERRDFIKSAVASAVTAGARNNASGQVESPARLGNPISRPMSSDMQYRDLGRTGEKASMIGLGGYHLG